MLSPWLTVGSRALPWVHNYHHYHHNHHDPPQPPRPPLPELPFHSKNRLAKCSFKTSCLESNARPHLEHVDYEVIQAAMNNQVQALALVTLLLDLFSLLWCIEKREVLQKTLIASHHKVTTLRIVVE